MNKESAYTPTYTEGKKYQAVKNLSLKDIAKLIRQEIRETYPEWKISVRVDHHSSIDLRVKDSPIKLYNKEWAILYIEAKETKDWSKFSEATRPYINRQYNHEKLERFTDEAKKIFDNFKLIVEQYNFDDSDSQTDYFHVNYYTSIGVDWECEDQLIAKSIKLEEEK